MVTPTPPTHRLLDDLDELDWSESIKDMQRNWIGRSEVRGRGAGQQLQCHGTPHVAPLSFAPKRLHGCLCGFLTVCATKRGDAWQHTPIGSSALLLYACLAAACKARSTHGSVSA